MAADSEVSLYPAVPPSHVQQVIGVQHPLRLPNPGQLLVKSLPLLLRQSCARTDTAEGRGLGTGCKFSDGGRDSWGWVGQRNRREWRWASLLEENTSFSSI